MTTKNQPVSQQDTSDREIVITRLLNAPRELVFEVWTDPKHVGNWFGPSGFTISTHEMSVKPGGTWRFMMHGPDGNDYPNKIVFNEVKKPELLTYRHGSDDDNAPGNFNVTVTFEDKGSKTQLTMRAVFATVAERDMVVKERGAIEGGNQTISKLEAYLAKEADENDLIIVREFNAPRELVFKAWTEPERMAQWWGPKGMEIVVIKADLKPGGVFHYCMKTPDGKEVYGKLMYREMVMPERIGFVSAFADEKGNTIPTSFFPVWPLEVWNMLTLAGDDSKTILTLRGRPINATEEENKAFHNMRSGMQQGFSGTFAQLDEYLANTGK